MLVLHSDRSFQATVREACGQDFSYGSVPDWEGLEEAIREGPPSAMVIVDPRFDGADRAGSPPSPRVKALLTDFPSLAVVAAMSVRPEDHERVRELGRWGIVQLIALGHDDTPAAIRVRLQLARGRPLRALLERVLPPETSGRGRAIIEAAADVVSVGEQGSDLARRLDISRRTLLRWSQRAGVPPPRLLLAWMRVLLACALLDDPGRGVLSVARSAGYATDSGLRRVTQNFLGASPSALRDRGAFAVAAAGFTEVLRESRLKARITTREG